MRIVVVGTELRQVDLARGSLIPHTTAALSDGTLTADEGAIIGVGRFAEG